MAQNESRGAIRWPVRYAPSRTSIHVSNRLAMNASPENVWAWLLRAELWPSWYPNSRNVRIIEGNRLELALNSRFCWRTFGVTIESVVEEFVPCERIAWSGKRFGLDVYHAWLIEKTDTGCDVLTEETQYGFLARMGKLFFPRRMRHFHQVWLEALAANAATGLPPQ